MSSLPSQLFRGDADEHGKRQLRSSWCRGYLLTNLAIGGIGKEVFSAPLERLVIRHIRGEWARTHFLSFTADRAVAERFARGTSSRGIALVAADTTSWDTCVLTVACSRVDRITPIGDGFFEVTFKVAPVLRPGCSEFLHFAHAKEPAATAAPERTLLMVDVVRALESAKPSPEVTEAHAKARRDKEWLLLPTDPMGAVNADGVPGELTAKIETTIVTSLDKYRWEP